MNKECAQGVFIRFVDFRGELLIRASAIDGVSPLEKDKATYILLNGNRVSVELPFNEVSAAVCEAQNISAQSLAECYREIVCRDNELSCA